MKRTSRFPDRWRSAALLLSILALASAAHGQRAAGGISGFQRIGTFILEVEGQEVPGARVFQAQEPPAFLVDATEFEAPVLIHVRDRKVQSVSLMKMAEREGGSVDLLPGAAIAEHGQFEVKGLATGVRVTFSVDGVQALLKPKPPLLGLNGARELVQHSPEYAYRASLYQPSEPIMERLREQQKEVVVKVFFGSWCPACGQMVPRILKVDEQLRGSRLRVEYYGLPQGFQGEPEATRFEIKSVPTAVVFVNGEPVGRIEGNGWRLPEMTINRIIASG